LAPAFSSKTTAFITNCANVKPLTGPLEAITAIGCVKESAKG